MSGLAPDSAPMNPQIFMQPPPPAYPDVVGYGHPPSSGHTPPSQNVVHNQQGQYDGQPIAAQPVIIQQPYGQLMAPQSGILQQQYGQPILIQNQYGQPIMVQGGVQTLGVVPFAIDPHNPSQNECSVSTKCPHCHTDITTTTQYVVGSCTWIWCIFLAFMGCLLCCCIPFMWNGAKDVIHTCPNCKSEVGRFVRQQRSNVRVHAGGGHHRRHHRRR